MISPKNVRAAALERENENLRFRTFLKTHTAPDELDERFLALHEELFDGYDCCKCGNCCRTFNFAIPMAEGRLDIIRSEESISGCKQVLQNVWLIDEISF